VSATERAPTEHVPGSIAIATVSLMPIGHGDGGKDSSTLVFWRAGEPVSACDAPQQYWSSFEEGSHLPRDWLDLNGESGRVHMRASS